MEEGTDGPRRESVSGTGLAAWPLLGVARDETRGVVVMFDSSFFIFSIFFFRYIFCVRGGG